jgi:uncharacterized protein
MDTPLTEAEFALLDDFLTNEEAPSDAMDTTMLDGFLAAVASGPNLVMPDQMLRWVWDTENGEESPEFTSNKHAQTIVGLIMRHYQYVNGALNDKAYVPRMVDQNIEAWCAGYYVAIAADMAAWAPLLIAQPKMLSTILLFGTTDGEEIIEKQRLTDQGRNAAVNSLVESARAIHAYWLDQRRQALNRGEVPGIMPRRQPARAPVKVGRNEPCPCGSGKKYKHCHGGSGAGKPPADNQWLH